MAANPGSTKELQKFYDKVIGSHKRLAKVFSGLESSAAAGTTIQGHDASTLFRTLANRERAMRSQWIAVREMMVSGSTIAAATAVIDATLASAAIIETDKIKTKKPKSSKKEAPNKTNGRPDIPVGQVEKTGKVLAPGAGVADVRKIEKTSKSTRAAGNQSAAGQAKTIQQEANQQGKLNSLTQEPQLSKKARKAANRKAREMADQTKQQALSAPAIKEEHSPSTRAVGDIIIKQEPLESWEI